MKYNYNELAHIAINYAIWIRHLSRNLDMYIKIEKDTIIDEVDSVPISEKYPLGVKRVKVNVYDWVMTSFDRWFDNLAGNWRELANRDKREYSKVFSRNRLKQVSEQYSLLGMDSIFDNWYEEQIKKMEEKLK